MRKLVSGVVRRTGGHAWLKKAVIVVAAMFLMPLAAGGAAAQEPAESAASIDVDSIPEASESKQASGLFVGKSATVDSATGRTATVTLDAYAGGDVTTTESGMPTDIVLVLDASGSMDEDIDGSTGVSRLDALKKSVNQYIDDIYKDATSKSITHQLSIIRFSGDISTGSDPTDSVLSDAHINGSVSQTTIDSYKSLVSSIETGGSTKGTMTGDGMKAAYEELESKYAGDGNDHTVVLFTDGEPGVSGWGVPHCSEPDANDTFKTVSQNPDVDITCGTWADSYVLGNEAIGYAQKIKDSGAAVYAIGLGLNIDTTSSAWLQQDYLGTNMAEFIANLRTKSADPYHPFLMDSLMSGGKRRESESQRFLEFVSSDTEGATSISQTGVTQSSSGHVLTASTSDDLAKAFATIELNSPSIQLGTSGQLRDYVTPDWQAPDFASAVKVYEQPYLGSDAWGAPEDITSSVSVTPSSDGTGFAVSGYDYSANYVSETPRTENGASAVSASTYGSRLVVQFQMTAKDCFQGGAGVATNTTESAVYESADSSKSIGDFPVPSVDVTENGSAGCDVDPCYVGGSSVPSAADCAALSDDATVRNGAAYEYAVIGGGDGSDNGSDDSSDDGGTGSAGNDGYKGLISTDSATTLVAANPKADLTWTFSVGGADVGKYVVTAGSEFSQGTWTWAEGAKDYLEGVGNHDVTVTLDSSEQTSGHVKQWNPTVDVYVPFASVNDTKVALGDSNPMSGNVTAGKGELASGVYWRDATTYDVVPQIVGMSTSGENNVAKQLLLTAKPATDLQSVYLGGTNPGKVMEASDSFAPQTDTTFKVQVVLSGDAVSALSPDYDAAADTKTVGPSGQTYQDDSNPTATLVADGAKILVNNDFNLYGSENKPGVTIGAVMDSAENMTDRDGSKAAFTVYVEGPIVSYLPDTGGAGAGRVLLLTALSTVLMGGVVAASSWLGKRNN